MKLLSWNIMHGGGTRIPRIVDAIAAHDADVIALTEFRTTSGAAICGELATRGWPYSESTGPAGSDNGVCIISRTRVVRTPSDPALSENSARWLDVDLPQYGFGVGVQHIMCSSSKLGGGIPGEAKTRFWNAVIAAAGARLHAPHMFVGDWNTGLHRMDEKGKTFACAEHFAKLSALGWTDLWRHHNTGATEWTWYSKLKGGAVGNGFRLDHAFASPSLCPRIISCRYSHTEREAGLSDHSVVIVEVG
ncbi:MAG: endonuclease/exonuclease/phosphatase family protein [Candidatus Solibacter sp.]